mgnify:CR=1 FL=1
MLALSPMRIAPNTDADSRAILQRALAADTVIFTSPNAVAAAHALQPLAHAGGQTWLAVGAGTLRALQLLGIDATAPARMDSEGLLALPALQALAGRTVALITAPGGRGLLVLLDAMTATLTGTAPARHTYHPAAANPEPARTEPAPPRFEVMYLLTGSTAEAIDTLRAALDTLGDSVAITAGRTGAHSVHVHTDDAGAAVEAGLAAGMPSGIQVTLLTGARPVAAGSQDRAVLAVVDGDGAATLFGDEGARVLRPEDGRPISAQQLLRALVESDAAQIMLLPNGFIAAEELVAGCTAATGWGIDVVPVPTASMVQGLAALAVHDIARHGVDDAYTMARAAAGARHGSVRIATEDALTWAGSCKIGDGLGITGDEVLIVGRDVVAAAAGLIDLLLASGGELVTILIGAGVDDGVGDRLREHVRRRHLGAELVSYRTDHDGDALLIGVE